MPAPADLVHQTSSSTGTGSLTLASVNGKRDFATVFSTGGSDVFDYFISNRSAAEWERGTGHMSDSTTLVRDTVIASSNSNSAVNFTAGTLDVTNDVPASKQVYTDGTQTLTAKRVTPRVTSETSSATPTINTDNSDVHRVTALAADITSMTTNLSGTPTHGQKLIVEITGTATRAITWGASFESSTATLPTTTDSTTLLRTGLMYNSATSKWSCVAVA